MRPFEWLYSGRTTRSPLHAVAMSTAATATRVATVVRMATAFATSEPASRSIAIVRSRGRGANCHLAFAAPRAAVTDDETPATASVTARHQPQAALPLCSTASAAALHAVT